MSKFLNLLKLRGFSTAADSAVEVAVSTDTQPRLQIDAGGKHSWGAGNTSAVDTNLYRSAADTLKTDDSFIAAGGLTIKTVEVDTAGATTSQALVYDGTKFAPATVASGGTTISDTPPVSPTNGQMWYESDSGKTFIYYDSFWVEAEGAATYDNITGTIQSKGDLIVGVASQELSRVGVGADNTRLIADSTQTTGLRWAPDTQNNLIDAKGDLLVGTADNTVTRQPVGANDQMLVANSGVTNGVSWINQPNSFRNAVINGGFDIWQRGTPVTLASTGFFFTADRWQAYSSASNTLTVTRTDFTTGTVLGNATPKYHARVNSSSGGVLMLNRIEGVNTFAGQTVTVSFYARAQSAATVGTSLTQVYGTGSTSGAVQVTTTSFSVTTSWARYSHTFNCPSISGKNVTTNDYLELRISGALVNNYLDLWGVQVEENTQATPFEQRFTGTELALCQRYYWQWNSAASGENVLACGAQTGTTLSIFAIHLPVEMRSKPTVAIPSMWVSDQVTFTVAATINAATNTNANTKTLPIYVNHAAQGAQFRPIWFVALNASSTMNASAEL